MLTVNNFSMLFFLLIFATFPKGIFLLSYLVGLNINDKVCIGTIIDWNIIATSAKCFPVLLKGPNEKEGMEPEITIMAEGEEENPSAGWEEAWSKIQEEFSDQTIEFNMDELEVFKITYGVYSLGLGDVHKIVIHGLAEKINNLKNDLAAIVLKDRLPDDKVMILPIEAKDVVLENGGESCVVISIRSTDETYSTETNETLTRVAEIEYEQTAEIVTLDCGCAAADVRFQARGIYCVKVEEKKQTCYGEEGSPLICDGKLAAIALERYKCNPSDEPTCNVKTDAVDLFMSLKQNLDWFNTLEIDVADDTKIGVGADVERSNRRNQLIRLRTLGRKRKDYGFFINVRLGVY